MTATLVVLYVVAAVAQVGGVALVVVEALDAGGRWRHYLRSVPSPGPEHPADITARARHGMTFAESRAVVEMTRELLRFNGRRQLAAVGLLVLGIVTSLVADLVGATR